MFAKRKFCSYICCKSFKQSSGAQLTVGGVSRPAMDWVRMGGLSQSTMYRRLKKFLNHDSVVSRSNFSVKHGLSASREYKIWRGMINRCSRMQDHGSHNYVGRGITVCEAWRNSFEQFYADVGPRPSPKYSIDRYPDQNGNYEPGNVRWATQQQQARNMRVNRLLTINGVTRTSVEWAEISGIKRTTIMERIKRGWTHERAIFLPLVKARLFNARHGKSI